VTLLGLVSLAWSATGFFEGLTQNVTEACPTPAPGFVQASWWPWAWCRIGRAGDRGAGHDGRHRLAAAGRDALWPGVRTYQTAAWQAFSTVVSTVLPWSLKVLGLLMLYRFLPNETHVPCGRASSPGIAGLLWELVTRSSRGYLGSGLTDYSLVYGSLGVVASLMLWIYLSCMIILLGAHITSVTGELLSGRYTRTVLRAPRNARTNPGRRLTRAIERPRRRLGSVNRARPEAI